MFRRIAAMVMIAFFSSYAFGKVILPAKGPSLYTHYIVLDLEQPDSGDQQYKGFDVGLVLPMHKHLRASGGMKIIPDVVDDSKGVSINRNFYELYSSAGLTLDYLFRFNLDMVVAYAYESIDYNVAGTSENQTDSQLAWGGQFGLEYQVIDELLFSAKYGISVYEKDQKMATYTLTGVVLHL